VDSWVAEKLIVEEGQQDQDSLAGCTVLMVALMVALNSWVVATFVQTPEYHWLVGIQG
jgi:hypothetical protein